MNKPILILLRTVAATFAMLVAMVLLGAVSFIVLVKAGNYYDAHHAIQDAVVRGDDLGIGLFGIYWMLASLLVTIPSAVMVFWFIYRFIARKLVMERIN